MNYFFYTKRMVFAEIVLTLQLVISVLILCAIVNAYQNTMIEIETEPINENVRKLIYS